MNSKLRRQFLVLICTLGLCSHVAQAGRWVINFQTANNWMAGYIGDVTVCLHFQAPRANITAVKGGHKETLSNATAAIRNYVKEDCQELPWRHFQRGKPYTFGIEFAEDLPLEKARIFAKPMENDVCKQKYGDTWHVDQISFQNLLTGKLFNVDPKGRPMLVESKCGSRNEALLLSSFNVSIQRRPCLFDGIIYKDGEQFEDGCSALCVCKDSGISCVSRCPPSFANNCRQVYVPGECCPVHICEQSKSGVACPPYESSDCETANRTVDPGEYPWAAFIKLCNKNGCKRFCSGALLNEQWILTASECLFWNPDQQPVTPDQVRVIVGEHTLILAEDRDVEIAIENVTFPSNAKESSLALIKLKEAVVFDRAVQPAVLPKSRDQCLQLVQPACALSLTGWINIGAAEAEQYELYKLSTQIESPNSCVATPALQPAYSRKRKPPPPQSRSRDSGICLNLANDEPAFQPECDTCQVDTNSSDTCFGDKNAYLCTGERGRALVSKMQVASTSTESIEVNYLVGIISYQLTPEESPKGLCKKPVYRLAVNICQDLNWITDTLNTFG